MMIFFNLSNFYHLFYVINDGRIVLTIQLDVQSSKTLEIQA